MFRTRLVEFPSRIFSHDAQYFHPVESVVRLNPYFRFFLWEGRAFIFGPSQAVIFLCWLQYIVHEVVLDRQHVFINMDETGLSSCRHDGRGMAVHQRRLGEARSRRRPRDPVDRSNSCTTYMATVCDAAELQPLLPQVVLAKYTQNREPPAALQQQYRNSGFPLEFWHGTGGRVTPRIFRTWATRLRSVVSSFQPRAYIILILDCAVSHLDRDSMAHLRRLGILAVYVPARLTWLLQLLDVYGFVVLKAELRAAEARTRLRSASGTIPAGVWMKMAASVIRRCVVNRDFSDCFRRLGTAESCDAISSAVREYVGDVVISPRLPTLAEFARLINRPADSANTSSLHAMTVGSVLRVRESALHSHPPAGAFLDLPASFPAQPLPSRRRRLEVLPEDDGLGRVVDQDEAEPVLLHAFRPARNFRPVGAPMDET